MISPVKIWRNQKKVREFLGKTGEIVAWTLIRVPPLGFEAQAPYYVALVRIEDRVLIGQLVDITGIPKAGLSVTAVIRRLRQPDAEGIISYGIKYKPIDA